MNTSLSTLLGVEVTHVERVARDTNLYELTSLSNVLPQASPGSHIDVILQPGLIRQYSLLQCSGMVSSYSIAVKRSPTSGGGSAFFFDEVQRGHMLYISAPRNNFALDEQAAHSVLIAGGIGITPILAMSRKLSESRRPYQLYYAVKTREDVAFGSELAAIGHLHVHCDADSESVLDIGHIVETAPQNSHLYCCGPRPMLESFERVAGLIDPKRIHLEYFTPGAERDRTGGFTVVAARSGRNVAVQSGQTILDALREAGFDLPSSCEQGVCGTCEIPVLSGVPEHRDSFLNKAERERNKSILVCCSGSKSAELVLDL